MDSLFDTRLSLLQKSLDLRSARNNLLASNIANAETPGYKARDLVFEKALGEAMQSQTPGPLQVTDRRHLDGRQPLPVEMVNGEMIQSGNPVGSLDDNSVNLETEMAKLGENQVSYNALTRMMNYKFNLLKTVLSQGD
ncbi:MAG: flagellar basal body rod protein FlgB [Deltaproteobacteria bacterium]|nr:flagellar basal body rod protein FlgB [Deltaproteobacteria bacterium]